MQDIDSKMKANGVTSFSFAHVKNGEISAVFGSQELFPICSTSKVFTALLLLQLEEEGKLNLKTPVFEYLPWLKFPKADQVKVSGITPQQLLTHHAGISDEDDPVEMESLKAYVTDFIPQLKFFANPGEVFWYNNACYSLSGYLAELVMELPFEELIDQYILDKLEMRNTTFSRIERNIAKTSFGSKGPVSPSNFPSGGLYSTSSDLAKLAICLMEGGSFKGTQIFAPAVIEKLSAHQGDSFSCPFRYYGTGMGIEYLKGWKMLSHGGGWDAFGSYFSLIPDNKSAVISLFNHPGGYEFHPASILATDLQNGPVSPPAYPAQQPIDGTFINYKEETLDIAFHGNEMTLITSEKTHKLRKISEDIYQTDDQSVSVGIVANSATTKHPDYVMFNEYPIGYVSAIPFRRVR